MTENNAAQAIQEGERNSAADQYFKARAWVMDTNDNRRIFEAGFDRAYDLLSKLRAEGVQAGDERAAFEAVEALTPPFASRRSNEFREGYIEAKVDALRVLRRLASAPVAGEGVQASDERESEHIETLQRMRADYNPSDGPMSELKATALDAAIAALASAPVADEFEREALGRDERLREAASTFLNAYRARYGGIYGQIKKHAPLQDEVLGLVFAAREAQPADNAAPQASEAVRAHNDAIKAAAKVCTDIARQYDPQNNQEHALASELYSAALAIRKLEKDGGDCKHEFPVDGSGSNECIHCQQAPYARRDRATGAGDATGRTPTDYALEFAEYLAQKAEYTLACLNTSQRANEALLDLTEKVVLADAYQAAEDAAAQADESFTEAIKALQSAAFEFRKRRDRAALAAQKNPHANGGGHA